MEKDKVVYEGSENTLEKRVGNRVELKQADSPMIIDCHISHLGPRSGITSEEIDLAKRWPWHTRTRVEKKVKKFFKELLMSATLPTEQLLIKVVLNDDVSSRSVMDTLNHYGVYGCAGVINIHYEWRFRQPTYSDLVALAIMRDEESRESDYLCDIGAKGRRQYFEATKGIKEAHFIGEVVDLRLYRHKELKAA